MTNRTPSPPSPRSLFSAIPPLLPEPLPTLNLTVLCTPHLPAPQAPSIPFSTLVSTLNRAVRPSNLPDGYYTNIPTILVEPPCLGFHIIVFGAADWNPADFQACLDRFRLSLNVPEEAWVERLIRRRALGERGSVEMEGVRCQVFVERMGDLGVREMGAVLGGLPRLRHFRDGDGVWVARRGGGRGDAVVRLERRVQASLR